MKILGVTRQRQSELFRLTKELILNAWKKEGLLTEQAVMEDIIVIPQTIPEAIIVASQANMIIKKLNQEFLKQLEECTEDSDMIKH